MQAGAYGTKLRILRILRAILDRPFGYTRKQLATHYAVHEDTIKNDLKDLTNAGFVLEYDERYRYAFVQNKPVQQLKELLHFTAEDQELLYQAIDQISPFTKSGDLLKQKLASLYDFRQLGLSYLRRPYLTKLDLLLQAKANKQQVILHRYRSSNSNEVVDRRVEGFHPGPSEDILQAYDIEKKKLRHYRISRIGRVEITSTLWQYSGFHQVIATDPFRIVDANQVMIHLRLKVGGYNELLERYPLCKVYLEESNSKDIYDLQCPVNHRFLGLSNFILGQFHLLEEVVGPELLKEHLRQQINGTKKKL